MPRSTVLNFLSRYNKSSGLNQNIWGQSARAATDAAIESMGLELKSDLPAGEICDIELTGAAYHTELFGSSSHPYLRTSARRSGQDKLKICQINDVAFTNWYGYHLLRKGSDILTAFSSVYSRLSLVKELNYNSNVSIRLDAGMLMFDDSDGRNYCHFTLDYLSKIAFLADLSGTKSIIVDGALDANFNNRSFDVLRSKGFDIVGVNEGSTIHVNKLFAIENDFGRAHPAMACHPKALHFIRQLSGLSPPQSDTSLNLEILWVRRLSGRILVNEEELISRVRSSGQVVREVALENIDLLEQHRLFASYKYFVGVHGAGFTNLTYANTGSVVIEIFPDDNGTPTFAVLCSNMGMKHFSYIGESVRTNHINYPNVRVNDREFCDMIQSIIGAK